MKNNEIKQALRYLEEEYKMNLEDTDDISEEYAIKIISDYLDEMKFGKKISEVFKNIIDSDEIAEHEEIVKESMINIITEMLNETKKITVTKMKEPKNINKDIDDDDDLIEI